MSSKDKKKLILQDPDFIDSPRNKNSLSIYLQRNEGKEMPFNTIAKMLNLTEEETKKIYETALSKLRKHFK